MVAAAVVVVDATLAIKWALDEPDSAAARTLLAEWSAGATQPVAPPVLAYDLANVLFQQVRRGMFTLDDAERLLSDLLDLVVIVPFEREDVVEALRIADQQLQRTAYDSQYAALAQRLGCDYWTADDEFYAVIVAAMPFAHRLGERG
ncbi:MAG: type II toxin-antitoxin system VapC family toxin [Dehalococcoidia bacterium]